MGLVSFGPPPPMVRSRWCLPSVSHHRCRPRRARRRPERGKRLSSSGVVAELASASVVVVNGGALRMCLLYPSSLGLFPPRVWL